MKHDHKQDQKQDHPELPPREDTALPERLKSSLKGVLLVCHDCEDRGSGPARLRSKDVRKRLREALRPAKGRLRVVATGCLGPCPKKAMTVLLSAGGEVSVYGLQRRGQADAVSACALQALEEAAESGP